MLRPAETDFESPPQRVDSVAIRASRSAPGDAKSIYDRSFWLTYLSLTALMIGVSLMYRYADFITFLGGSELELGAVVGVGMIGSLLMRLAQGVGIDRFGPRHIWLASAALFVVSMLGHLLVSRSGGIAIYVLQAMYRTSIAGVFGAAFTYAFQRVPVARMAEAVGTVGTASFVGIVIGPILGDWIAGGRIAGGRGSVVGRTELNWLFLTAAGLGCVSFAAAWFATLHAMRPRPRRRLPMARVLRRYHPGVLLTIGVAAGVSLGLPATFLRTFAAELKINHLAPYFAVFAISATVIRLATRRMVERAGMRPTIVIGLLLLVGAPLSYLLVAAEWQLVFPALLTGAGQAILYPAVVAGGSAAFPEHDRGMGTSVMLATIDLGTLLGAPLIGGLVYGSKQIGLPGYPTMFICIAALLMTACVYYAWATRGAPSMLRSMPARPKIARPPRICRPTPCRPTLCRRMLCRRMLCRSNRRPALEKRAFA